MFEILSARGAGVAGILSLALATAALVSTPSFPTTAGLFSTAPAMSVNRALKGDRLPVLAPNLTPTLAPPVGQREPETPAPASPQSPARLLPPAPIPPGCDPAFSSISAPLLAHVFKRCIT